MFGYLFMGCDLTNRGFYIPQPIFEVGAVYVLSSFFNIYGAGAGIPPHTHLNEIDTDKHLHLAEQKYSLVYYLSVGDQNCSEPGILKLYDPSDDILPCEGMIVIIPAGRRHSAVYGGEKDRIIIGINFYSL